MNSEFYKMSCPNCGGGIEFPEHGLGSQIKCPHCQKPVVLKQQLLATVRVSFRPSWFAPTVIGSVVGAGVAVVTLILLAVFLFGGTPTVQNSDSPAQNPISLQDDLKALQKLTSVNSQQISKEELKAIANGIKAREPSPDSASSNQLPLVLNIEINTQFLLSDCYGENWDEAETNRVELQHDLEHYFNLQK